MNKISTKPIIGIIGVPTYDNEKDNTIAVYNESKNVTFQKGGIPFMICPLLNINYYETPLNKIPELTDEEKNIYEEMVDLCDGIIIPGGYRIYEFYKYITEYAIKKDIPVLGICLGMQTLASIDNNGNSLEKNEDEFIHTKTKVKYAHSVNIKKNTLLYDIIKKDKIDVNSKHKYHVSKVNKFKIVATSSDGLIEAIELPKKRFVLGLQWHPEKMIEYDPDANKIFDAFFEEINNEKQRTKEKIELL
ncbi:MAG: C26 family cysteine hydrolase domain-containing family [Bacilli bacterium]|nr:C26 family cysteine hydrolase domain-containing family [Bacilli bacterium]